MKKFLLLGACALMALGSMAENHFYPYKDMGEARAVSPDGRYALYCHPDNAVTYVWDRETKEFTVINSDDVRFDAYGIGNNKEILGAVYQNPSKGVAYWMPVIWEDGKYTELGLVEGHGNLNYAMRISDNGKIIGGYQSSGPRNESMARPNYPTIWEKQDNGEWVMHHYNDIELPAQQGFFVRGMVSDGTLEGTYLPGILTCAAGSYVPAYFHPGEGLVYWDTVEKRTITFEHKGKWYESIAWFIDDFYDGWDGEYFTGGFYGCDASGNCYGWRSYPNEPMPENGEGTFYTKAVVYNLFNKQWDERDGAYLVGGLWKEIYLLADGDMEINGQNVEPISHFGVIGEAAGYDFVGVSYISNDGRTLVGQYQEFNPATAQYDPFPAVIELSEPLTGVENVTAAEKAVKIQGLEGAIEVEGAQNVAVYDMQGRRVGTTGLAAGIYVVKADETTAKVIVK